MGEMWGAEGWEEDGLAFSPCSAMPQQDDLRLAVERLSLLPSCEGGTVLPLSVRSHLPQVSHSYDCKGSGAAAGP